MSRKPFWWPLDLSPRADAVLEEFRQKMQKVTVRLDVNSTVSAAEKLSAVMRCHVEDILERDGLPHLCHVINGWGNAKLNDRLLLEWLIPFVHRNESGLPHILQCDPEGEFHPWQSFAYSVMAGVAPDAPIPPLGVSLRELARNSRHLNTEEGKELGHLLFALAALDPNVNTQPFYLRGKERNVDQLMEMAVDAHLFGSFDVCRKFHLTEGLCAMASKVAGLEEYREAAQVFLDGQLEMMMLLAVILQEARHVAAGEVNGGGDQLLQELRETLVVGTLFENHCYYAGHAIELAVFAESFGYKIPLEYKNSMRLIINELNSVFAECLPHVFFPECFLHLGHYRRAITLMLETEVKAGGSQHLTRAALAHFSSDFDSPGSGEVEELAGNLTPMMAAGTVFDFAAPPSGPRPEFNAVLSTYSGSAAKGFEPRGKFDHFRRIMPATWPRAMHYEILDYGHAFGVEIHLESDSVSHLSAYLNMLAAKVGERFQGPFVEFEPNWYGHSGRLRVLYPADSTPDVVAQGMHTLIQQTFSDLDAVAKAISIHY